MDFGKENIVDPILEKNDPTPNIFILFRQFNVRFFWDKLNMVEVSWSGKQMTSCAGVCSFRPRTGDCRIRLSAPLLSLRPRKDLVETLLHEMIHAYLFITKNSNDRSDHGPEFHKHMYRINKEAGTNITVYHTFNDEVNHFKSHVWRCNGPCQKFGPFFGFLRRATARAPGPNDKWWNAHRLKCFGVFEKIEEPPGYKAKKKGSQVTKISGKGSSSDLRNFFTPSQKSPSSGNIYTLNDVKWNGSQKAVPAIVNTKVAVPSTSKTSNISQPSILNSEIISNVNMHVRNIWANKYPGNAQSSAPKRKLDSANSATKKKSSKCEHCQKIIDVNVFKSHCQTCPAKNFPCPVCSQSVLNGALEEHLSICLSDSITEDIFCSDEVEIIKEKYPNDTNNVPCPICGLLYTEININGHIDECLNLKAINEGILDK